MGGGHGPITNQGTRCPGRGDKGWGTSSLGGPIRPRGERQQEPIKQIEPRGGSSIMNPEQEKLLEDFESFECDLELEAILAKVKKDFGFDQGVTEFGEQLKQREEEKRAAQIQRETQVQQQWSPWNYPQHTCAWFVQGLDFCCGYWRY